VAGALDGAHEFVMCWWMMLREVVGTVLFARCPIEIELSLHDSVLEPVVLHVKSLGALHADGGMKDAMSSGVVGFDWCPR
jgi:hypothetical protein